MYQKAVIFVNMLLSLLTVELQYKNIVISERYAYGKTTESEYFCLLLIFYVCKRRGKLMRTFLKKWDTWSFYLVMMVHQSVGPE